MDLGWFSLTGPREANEDNRWTVDLSDVGFSDGVNAFLLVSDGMGGYQGGDVASQLTVEAAQSYIGKLREMAQGNQVDLDASAALKEIVQNAHEAIIATASERGNASMGATFVGAFVSPDHAWIGHVGDSRAYLIRDGVATQLTEDHSQVGRMLSQGIITEEEAQNHPSRNRIERALGFPNFEIEFDEIDLQEGDTLMLCSDGVYTVLSCDDIAQCMDAAPNATAAANQLVNLAIKEGSDDNSTAAVLMTGADVVKVAQTTDPFDTLGAAQKRGKQTASKRAATRTLTGNEDIRVPDKPTQVKPVVPVAQGTKQMPRAPQAPGTKQMKARPQGAKRPQAKRVVKHGPRLPTPVVGKKKFQMSWRTALLLGILGLAIILFIFLVIHSQAEVKVAETNEVPSQVSISKSSKTREGGLTMLSGAIPEELKGGDEGDSGGTTTKRPFNYGYDYDDDQSYYGDYEGDDGDNDGDDEGSGSDDSGYQGGGSYDDEPSSSGGSGGSGGSASDDGGSSGGSSAGPDDGEGE